MHERARNVEPEGAHEELEPVPLLVHAVAAGVEHADHRLAEHEELAGGEEVHERRARRAERRRPAGDGHGEAARAAGAEARGEAEVLDRGRDVVARSPRTRP